MSCPVCDKPTRPGNRYCSSGCAGKATARPPEERILERVRFDEGGCITWTSTTNEGYGRLSISRRKHEYAHRITWQIAFGPIPEDLEIDHLCENRRCVNPMHMRLVTKHEHGKRSAWQRWHR